LIVEHVFITTLDAPAALRLASEFLTAAGFRVMRERAFSVDAPWTKLDVARGVDGAARAKSIDQLPQRLVLEWDRGRVTVAASIEWFAPGAFRTGSAKEPPPHSPKIRPHIELMHGLMLALEALLARRVPMEEARQPWAELEARLRAESIRQRRKRNTVLWSVVVGIFLLVFLIIVLAVASH
jgi:hypothetical protein